MQVSQIEVADNNAPAAVPKDDASSPEPVKKTEEKKSPEVKENKARKESIGMMQAAIALLTIALALLIRFSVADPGVYVGEYLEGKRHGQGNSTYSDG